MMNEGFHTLLVFTFSLSQKKNTCLGICVFARNVHLGLMFTKWIFFFVLHYHGMNQVEVFWSRALDSICHYFARLVNPSASKSIRLSRGFLGKQIYDRSCSKVRDKRFLVEDLVLVEFYPPIRISFYPLSICRLSCHLSDPIIVIHLCIFDGF